MLFLFLFTFFLKDKKERCPFIKVHRKIDHGQLQTLNEGLQGLKRNNKRQAKEEEDTNLSEVCLVVKLFFFSEIMR